MSGLEDLKTTPSVETDKSVPVDKPKTPETGNILGDSAPDTTSTPAAPQTPQTPDAPKTDGGVELPTGTAVNPQNTDVKKLDQTASADDSVSGLQQKLTEIIKALEFDYPILRQLSVKK